MNSLYRYTTTYITAPARMNPNSMTSIMGKGIRLSRLSMTNAVGTTAENYNRPTWALCTLGDLISATAAIPTAASSRPKE